MVYLPENDQVNLMVFNEVTVGIGGIVIGASFCGLKCNGSLDINPMVAMTLRANRPGEVMLGDILQPQDRCKFFLCADAERGWVFSGYPCQPLSRQGDQGGRFDKRADVFYGVTKFVWES